MFGNYARTAGMETFNRGFGSARYNSTGSIYSILDSSKTFAATGKKILSFNTGDSAVQAQAKKYGVEKAAYDASVVKAQLDAPDLLPKQKYAGGTNEEGKEVPGKEEEAAEVDEAGYEAGGEEVASKRKAPKGLRAIKKSAAPKGGAEAGTEGEGVASEGSKGSGSDSDVSKGTVKSSRTITDTEAIGEEAYDALPEKASQSVLNRAKFAKKVPFLKDLDVRVDTTKTKPAMRINFASNGERAAALMIIKEEIAKGTGSSNYKRFLSYLAGGTALKVVEGAKSSEGLLAYLKAQSGKKASVPKGHKTGKKEAVEPKVFPPAAAVGGGGSAAAAAVAAELREESGSDWEVAGKKKRGKKGKGKA